MIDIEKKTAAYYNKFYIKVSHKDIIVTTGASEVLLFLFSRIMDPGDEVIISESFYANYIAFSNVTSSCGCTIPKKPEGPILPGKTGQIEVKYDTNRVNPIRKTITVISNADTPTVALKIKGDVIDSSTTNVLEKKEKSVMQQ